MMNFEMTDCNVSTPDDDEPFPITGSGDDAEWIEPIPPKRDLLTYAQARNDWRCSDADLAGWINSGRVMAYSQTADGYFSPFNWLRFPATDSWQNEIRWLLFNPVPDFELESEARYLDYADTIKLLKKHDPKLDAAGFLAKGAIGRAEINRAEICTKGWPMPDLLAITLNSFELTPDNLPDCIYIRSQIQSLVARKEPTRKNGDYSLTTKQIEDYHRAGLTQEEIKALGVRLCRVRKVTAGMKHCQRGTKPK